MQPMAAYGRHTNDDEVATMQQRIFKEHRPSRRDRSQVVDESPFGGGDDTIEARNAAAAATAAAQATLDAIDAALATG